jgi:hypothetical protein
MINELSRNPIFSLRYFPPAPSRISPTPHSHSIVLSYGNTLMFQRNFFFTRQRTDSAIRQKIGLLNSKANFADFESAQFQGLSVPIGQFLESADEIARTDRLEKKPSTTIARFISPVSPGA